MQFDEWNAEAFDEWDTPLVISFDQPEISTPQSPSGPLSGVNQGPYPEVELGSSSDEDAPRPPQSTQLARENHALRTMMSGLKSKSVNLQQQNGALKSQLASFRSLFRSQMKTSFGNQFK